MCRISWNWRNQQRISIEEKERPRCTFKQSIAIVLYVCKILFPALKGSWEKLPSINWYKKCTFCFSGTKKGTDGYILYFQMKKIFSEFENLVVGTWKESQDALPNNLWRLILFSTRSALNLKRSPEKEALISSFFLIGISSFFNIQFCFYNFLVFLMFSFGFWFHLALSTTIFSFCVISVGFLLFCFLIYEHHVQEGTFLRRTHQRPMEWHRYLLSNHRSDKSKDDDNIYDNDENNENNVVGPIKRLWNANNFSKNWAQKTSKV